MNIRHPGQLKKWKSWGPFWSYQLNSTANPAHLPQNRAKLAVLFSWLLQNGPQHFEFSTAMGAYYSFYVKFIATYAHPTFLRHNNSVLAIVLRNWNTFQSWYIFVLNKRCTNSGNPTSNEPFYFGLIDKIMHHTLIQNNL